MFIERYREPCSCKARLTCRSDCKHTEKKVQLDGAQKQTDSGNCWACRVPISELRLRCNFALLGHPSSVLFPWEWEKFGKQTVSVIYTENCMKCAHTRTHSDRCPCLNLLVSIPAGWYMHCMVSNLRLRPKRSRQSVNVALQCDRNDCKAYNIPFTPPTAIGLLNCCKELLSCVPHHCSSQFALCITIPDIFKKVVFFCVCYFIFLFCCCSFPFIT